MRNMNIGGPVGPPRNPIACPTGLAQVAGWPQCHRTWTRIMSRTAKPRARSKARTRSRRARPVSASGVARWAMRWAWPPGTPARAIVGSAGGPQRPGDHECEDDRSRCRSGSLRARCSPDRGRRRGRRSTAAARARNQPPQPPPGRGAARGPRAGLTSPPSWRVRMRRRPAAANSAQWAYSGSYMPYRARTNSLRSSSVETARRRPIARTVVPVRSKVMFWTRRRPIGTAATATARPQTAWWMPLRTLG